MTRADQGEPEMYRTAAVCRLTGATWRQLHYWNQIGALVPSGQSARGTGTRRLYTDDDLPAIRLMVLVSEATILNRPGRSFGRMFRDIRSGMVADALVECPDGFIVLSTTNDAEVVAAEDLASHFTRNAYEAMTVIPVAALKV